jgi:hypothetical protein
MEEPKPYPGRNSRCNGRAMGIIKVQQNLNRNEEIVQ